MRSPEMFCHLVNQYIFTIHIKIFVFFSFDFFTIEVWLLTLPMFCGIFARILKSFRVRALFYISI